MLLRSNAIATTQRLLTRHDLFGSLTPSELDQLLNHSRLESHPAKEEIFRKGSPGVGLIVVLKGNVRISSIGPSGEQIVLNLIGEGEVFGEIALLDGKERTADATAASDCELLLIDRRDFVPFLRSNPDVALRLLTVLCDRLRRTTEQVEDLIFLNAECRLAKKLLQLGGEGRRRATGNGPIGVDISQRELGTMLGLSRESINKQLSVWHRDGIIKVGRSAITILDERALRDFAEAL